MFARDWSIWLHLIFLQGFKIDLDLDFDIIKFSPRFYVDLLQQIIMIVIIIFCARAELSNMSASVRSSRHRPGLATAQFQVILGEGKILGCSSLAVWQQECSATELYFGCNQSKLNVAPCLGKCGPYSSDSFRFCCCTSVSTVLHMGSTMLWTPGWSCQ